MLESLKIRVGGRTLELTPEEARVLKAELNTLFPDPLPYYPPVVYPVWPTYPTPSLPWVTICDGTN